jgi:hypothetical protein
VREAVLRQANLNLILKTCGGPRILLVKTSRKMPGEVKHVDSL